MRRVYLVTVAVVLLALVAGQAMAVPEPDPADWVPSAVVPVELLMETYGKITVIDSVMNLEMFDGAPPSPPIPEWPGGFVRLDVESNLPVVLDVTASQNGRLRSDQGAWFKYDPEKGTYVWYGVCGGWATTSEEFDEFIHSGGHMEGLGPGCWWNPDTNQLDGSLGPGPGPYQIPEAGIYPPGWDGESWPVTLGGWGGLAPTHGYVAPGIYRGELTITLYPQS